MADCAQGYLGKSCHECKLKVFKFVIVLVEPKSQPAEPCGCYLATSFEGTKHSEPTLYNVYKFVRPCIWAYIHSVY